MRHDTVDVFGKLLREGEGAMRMNWEGIKTVLIVAFLLLDLLLGWSFWQEMKGERNDMDGQWMESDMLKSRLERSGVTLPEWRGALPELRYWSLQTQTDRLTGQANEKKEQKAVPIVYNEGQWNATRPPLSVLEDKEKANQWIPHYSSYTLAKKDTDRHLYYETQEGYPVFDLTLEIWIEGERIRAYRQSYAAFVDGGEARVLISPYVAVQSLLDQKLIGAGTHIESIAPGYRLVQPEAQEAFLVPVWRIVTDRSIYDVNGFVGTILQNGP